jgi:membrane fusion protein (multidrug efflux system)
LSAILEVVSRIAELSAMFTRRRHLGVAGVLLTVAALAAGVSVARHNKITREAGGDIAITSGDSTADLPMPVEGITARRSALTLTVIASGQAEARRRFSLAALVTSRVTTLGVREGQTVHAGAPLVELEATDYALALEEARARLSAAETQFRELVIFDERLADTVVRNARATAARAKSGLDVADVAVRRAELDLSRAHVVAPSAGQVANVRIVPGQWVRIGDPLLEVLDVDPIRVEAQVLEGDVTQLERGRGAAVSFIALPGRTFGGRVESINPLVDPQARTVRVTVSIPNPNGRILPGMYARIVLDTRVLQDRLVIPRRAVLERDHRTLVFVYARDGSANGEGRAEWRYVALGAGTDSLVEILPGPPGEGVAPGEIVLTDGQEMLIHGARTRLVTSRAAAP